MARHTREGFLRAGRFRRRKGFQPRGGIGRLGGGRRKKILLDAVRLWTGGVDDCENCGDVDPITGKWTPTPDGPFGKWACENCRASSDDVSPYAEKIVNVYLLKIAGYPFAKDDLDPDDWKLIGMMEATLKKASDFGL